MHTHPQPDPQSKYTGPDAPTPCSDPNEIAEDPELEVDPLQHGRKRRQRRTPRKDTRGRRHRKLYDEPQSPKSSESNEDEHAPEPA